MIKLLPKNVADKIAAGEVVERPVSVIKELVENSIDAGASSIYVDIKKGGLEEIRVTDNGVGIPKVEVETAFLRHATSKITSLEDLSKIDTLGFRGEALASIAAVSRTEIITRTEDDDKGVRLIIHGSEIIKKESVGCPIGTTIIVRNLFFNTPARAAFMKSEGAESGMIIDMMSRLAITVPEKRISLSSNSKSIFTSPGTGNILNTIIAVYKEKELKDLVPVKRETASMRVYGYVSKPSFTRTNRRSQYFFVNGRTIKSTAMEKGISTGYKERLFEGRYPIAYLFLEIDPEKLDVNVHPNKREVRFHNEMAITTFISEAVSEALLTEKAVIKASENLNIEKRTREDSFEYQVNVKDFTRINKILEEKREEKKQTEVPIEEIFDISSPPEPPFDFSELTMGDILFGTYITATDEDNFYLFDQHAAHERINYEKFVETYMSSEKPQQILMLPFTFDVPPELLPYEEDWLSALSSMAYDIEKFGDATYICRAIPTFVSAGEGEEFLKLFIDEVHSGNIIDHKIVIDKLITKACKASIKAHDMIKPEEVAALIKQLSLCRNPFSCPHGRPTFIRFSLYDLEKMFKRVV